MQEAPQNTTLPQNLNTADKEKVTEKWQRFRLHFITLLLLILFSAVIYRFFTLQTKEEHLQHRAEKQSTGSITLGAGGEHHLDGHRGYIYDRHGIELAVSVETPSVFAHPSQIEDPHKHAEKLASILNIDPQIILQKLQSKAAFVWIARKIKPDQAQKIRNLKLSGIGTKRESKRYYPAQDLAAQILGFVGMDNVGLEGIEAAFDKALRGDVIKLKGMRDARGKIILTTDSPRLNELEGSSLVLTIDQYIQKVTENAIERAARNFGAKAATAVVMDPWTGEVLALANWPKFNPNRFADYDRNSMKNRAILDAYEPGSVMKAFSYAAAVDATGIKADDPVDQERGKLKIGKHTISDTHTIPNMTAETVVSESSNVGIYKLVQKIGKDKFYDYLRNFGFGQKTGINIAGETPGILWRSSRWPEIMFANVSFGQGVSTSPIQLAAAMSAIANGGNLPQPWIIREVRDQNANILASSQPHIKHRVISEKAAKQTRNALARVVKDGTGMRAWVQGYNVGGKTGTAQKVDPRTKAYTHKWMANFLGIAPIDNPNLVILVMIDEPKKNHSGGIVAAPAFAEIATQVLPYRGVYPLDAYTSENNPLKKFDSMTESPQKDSLLQFDNEQNRIPDFSGMTIYQALQRAKTQNLQLNFENTGFVVSQWPAAGTLANDLTKIELKLSPKYRQLKLDK